MYSIVPIIMALGAISFAIGIFFYARLGLRQVTVIEVFGKEYKLWRFVATTIGSGVLLIMLSIIIHKSFPYTVVKPDTPQYLAEQQTGKTDFEQELALSGIDDKLMVAYIRQFEHEYQAALQEDDENTIGLLRMELQFRLRTELKKQEFSPARIKQEVNRIMERLPQQSE